MRRGTRAPCDRVRPSVGRAWDVRSHGVPVQEVVVGRKYWVVGLALVSLFAAACGGMREPEVRMEGVRLGAVGLQGGLVYVQLRVVNPNRAELAAQRLEYDLDLADPEGDGWIDFAEGTYVEDMRVGGRDSALIEVPVEFTYRQAGRAIRSVLDRGTLNYRVRGRVDVLKPLRTEVPFRKTGVATIGG